MRSFAPGALTPGKNACHVCVAPSNAQITETFALMSVVQPSADAPSACAGAIVVPGHATSVYIFNIYQNAFSYGKVGYASAMAWILFAVIAAVTYLQWKLQKRWVFYT